MGSLALHHVRFYNALSALREDTYFMWGVQKTETTSTSEVFQVFGTSGVVVEELKCLVSCLFCRQDLIRG